MSDYEEMAEQLEASAQKLEKIDRSLRFLAFCMFVYMKRGRVEIEADLQRQAEKLGLTD
jgi:hypothetical protein